MGAVLGGIGHFLCNAIDPETIDGCPISDTVLIGFLIGFTTGIMTGLTAVKSLRCAEYCANKYINATLKTISQKIKNREINQVKANNNLKSFIE